MKTISWFSFALVLGLAVLPAQAEIRIHGRLVDAKDAGVGGVEIHLEDFLSGYERVALRFSGRVAPDPSAVARTDGDGYFVMTAPGPGAYRVTFAAPGHLAMEYVLRPVLSSRELPPVVLVPATTYELKVVDAGGRAAAGARVAAYTRGQREWRPRLHLTQTDENGIAVVPRGRDAELDLQVLAPGHPLFVVDPERRAALKARPKLTLSSGIGGRVRVVDGAGKGVADALLYQVGGLLALARTDADGLAPIVLAPARDEPPTVWAITTAGDLGSAGLRFDGPLPAPKKAGAVVVKVAARAKLPGQVIDSSTGDPIAGATVWINAGDGVDPGRRRYGDELKFTSTRDGNFELSGLPAQGRSLFFQKEGFAPHFLDVEGLEPFEKREGLRVVLRAGSTAVGTVLDSGDVPVAGADVRLQPAPPTDRYDFRRYLYFNQERWAVATDAKGRFRIPHILAETYTLKVQATGFSPLEVPGLVIGEEAGDTDLGTVVLAPGASIAGIVLDPSGVPLAGAEIRTGPAEEYLYRLSLRAPPAATSDTSGHFRIDDFQHGRSMGLLVSHAGFAPRALIHEASENPELLEVSLEKAGRLRGRVTEASGDPVERAVVWVEQEPRNDWSHQYTRTDASGRFALDNLSPERQTLTARAEGYREYKLRNLEVPAGETFEGIEIVLKQGVVLTGRLLDSDGRPAPGVVDISRKGQQSPHSARTDETGQFRFDDLTPGSYVLEGQDRSYRRVRRELELAGGARAVDLILEPGWEVSGRVFEASGEGVAGARLILTPAPGPGERPPRHAFTRADDGARSRADGTFVLPDVAPGRYHLSAAKAGHASAKTSEPFEVDGPLPGIDLELPSGVLLRGRILGLEPEELPRLQVHAYRDGQYQIGRVDFEGQYTVPHLGPGEWSVRAYLSDSRTVTRQVQIAAGLWEFEADLELPTGLALSGTVTIAGEPAKDINVRLRDGSEEPQWRHAGTRLAGRFRFDGLPVGRYQLSVTSQGSILAEREIELDADLELAIDVAGATISGRVIDLTGQPISGVTLSLVERPAADASGYGRAGRMTLPQLTDSLGRFIGEVKAGDWVLMAAKDGYVPAEIEVRLAEAIPVDGLELTLTEAEAWSAGIVTAEGGVPSYVRLTVSGPDGRRVVNGTYRPDQDGRIHLSNVAAGTWDLLLRTDNGMARLSIEVPGSVDRVVLVEPGRAAELTLP